MSKPISLTRAAQLTHKVAEVRLEVIRITLVSTCAVALIVADRALPF
ncbi:hypothetical protein [Altererythrobacter sp. GH1-8]